MKHRLFLIGIVFLAACSTSYGQSIPQTCKPGDVVDSFDGDWKMCPKENTWAKFKSFDPNCGGAGSCIYTEPPPFTCRLEHKDADGNIHCPWETATGRVVACMPCPEKYKQECSSWYRECRSFVEFQATHSTAEPDMITLGVPTPDHVNRFMCPDGWYVRWFNREHTYHSPVCVKAPKNE